MVMLGNLLGKIVITADWQLHGLMAAVVVGICTLGYFLSMVVLGIVKSWNANKLSQDHGATYAQGAMAAMTIRMVMVLPLVVIWVAICPRLVEVSEMSERSLQMVAGFWMIGGYLFLLGLDLRVWIMAMKMS